MTEDALSPTTPVGRAVAGEFPTCPRRGPLRSIILAGIGQDMRLYANCANTDGLTAPGMDRTIGEIVRAAARNDPRALTCTTLAACEDLLLRPIPCTVGLDPTSILIFVQCEAELRGLASSPEVPRP